MARTGSTLPLPFTTCFKIGTKFYENLSSVSRAITCVQKNGLKGQFRMPFSISWKGPKKLYIFRA